MCGEKPHGSSGFFRRWDHPRVCGEKLSISSAHISQTGSPPRVRGKACLTLIIRLLLGITPAYAGKRPTAKGCSSGSRDYPRVCGEKSLERFRSGLGLGSPPRMRGKGGGLPRPRFGGGITPAYAGKRSQGVAALQLGWDHPRVCGEKPELPPAVQRHVGSPPRMRGKGSRMTRATSMVGITPACAGKSARRQAGPPGPAPPPQMRLGWSPPPCTGRQCRTRKSTHARRARIPVPAHTPAPQ